MTVLVMTGVVGAMPMGVLAGCGADTGAAAAVQDGPGPTPSVTAPPLLPSRGTPTGTPGSTPGGIPLPSETRPPADLLSQARAAFLAAPSVHVTGTAVRGSDAYVVDARLAGRRGGTATIKTSGETVSVVRLGDVAYVGGDLAFWRTIVGDDAKARQMVGRSVRTGVTEPNFSAFVAFTQPDTFAQVLPDPARPATLTTATTVRGTDAVGIRDQGGSTLVVARTGTTYPLRLDGLTNGQVVFLDFADYGAPVLLKAPNPVTQQGPGHGS